MREYQVNAEVLNGDDAVARVKQSEIKFDAAAEDRGVYPNPAELLLEAFSACVLKNVERYSQRLHYPYRKARISVKGYRSDVPPVITKVEYVLEIDTDIEEKRLNMWHKNIIKFGTITNTLMRSSEVSGIIKKWTND